MKRILIFILALSLLSSCALTLCSCNATLEETEPLMAGSAQVLLIDGVPLDMASRYCSYYSYYYAQRYLPREGEFTTEGGESFVCEIDNCYLSISTGNGLDTSVVLAFDMAVYSTEGELIAQGRISSRNNDDGTLDLSAVDESLRVYWQSVAVVAQQLTAGEG